jgi:hypothetical protein
VSPDILGLASGAAFGAALSMCIIPNLPTAPVAFLFSFLALTFAWSMARTKGETSVVNLVLAGVMTSAIFSSLLALIQFAVDSKALQSIVFWMMGSLNTACWSKVHLIILPRGRSTCSWCSSRAIQTSFYYRRNTCNICSGVSCRYHRSCRTYCSSCSQNDSRTGSSYVTSGQFNLRSLISCDC